MTPSSTPTTSYNRNLAEGLLFLTQPFLEVFYLGIPFDRCRRMPAAGVPFSVHLTGLLSVLLRCNVSLRFRELQGIRWAADHQTVTMTFFGASLALGSALELLLQLIVLYKIHFPLHVTIQSRNGSSLLHRIREDDTSK